MMDDHDHDHVMDIGGENKDGNNNGTGNDSNGNGIITTSLSLMDEKDTVIESFRQLEETNKWRKEQVLISIAITILLAAL